MRIVYGVSGEGLGHVFEALEIGAYLQRQGHALRVLTYGERALGVLAPFRPMRIEGFPLYFTDRGLSLPRTIGRNLPAIRFFLTQWARVTRELRGFDPDVVLTAYEPFTTLVAHLLRRPLVSMDNQAALLHVRSAPPGQFAPFHLARAATRLVTLGSRRYVIKSFSPPPGAPPPNVRFVAPMVQREIRHLRPRVGDHVLVYLTKPHAGILRVLRAIERRFIVYCCDRSGADGNLTFRAHGPQFLEDLAGCAAIIGTTGFSLIADAIYLRKPYFGVPLKGQFEQRLNARFLADSGLGEFSEEPARERIERFFGRLPLYRERLAARRFDPSEQEQAVLAALREVAAPAPGRLTDASLALSPE